MTTTGIAEKIQHLFEPAARAARRGDPGQIRNVLNELRSLWTGTRRKKKPGQTEELARGMTYALEGVLGIVLASAGTDARRALLEGRKHALPILHTLGRKARAVRDRGMSESDVYSLAAVQKGELAVLVGVLAQNIGELIQAMNDCGLVTVRVKGSASHVALTEVGAQMLEAVKPGWQLTEVEQDHFGGRLAEGMRESALQWQKLVQTHDSAPPQWHDSARLQMDSDFSFIAGKRQLHSAGFPGVFESYKIHSRVQIAYASSPEGHGTWQRSATLSKASNTP